MRHLTLDQLIDLAEGTRPESSVPHLESCDRCRGQLADLRAMRSAAAGADVPEPSPLFWDHLSARVSEAVAAQAAAHRESWLERAWSQPAVRLLAAALAVILLAAALTTRVMAPNLPGSVEPPPSPVAIVADAAPLGEPAAWQDDPSLDLVADLAAAVQLDVVSESGLTTHANAADAAIDQLTEAERRELHRLLKEELAHSGA